MRTMPHITITTSEWGKTAACSCGWQAAVPDPTPAGDAHLMAMVDSHLEAHRREAAP
ncbi:hypothetical protein HRbin24_00092 [bacterium HR24]|nr:hypothetical protein HRbin24_00092 [bacterium HR24]